MPIGPGLVYVLQVQGTGDIVSNTATGAGYGYTLLWALALTLLMRFVWVNTSAKYVLVTGESLLTGYARLGNWVVWIVLVAIVVLRHFYSSYQILMMGSAADLLFHLPTEWSVPIWSVFFTCSAFALVFWGGYPAIEFFCKILVTVMGASLVITALLAQPDAAQTARGLFLPTIPGSQGLYSVFFLLMALVGTEAGSMGNLTYAYYLREKGWNNVSYLKQQRFDLAFGVICLFIMGALLQIAAAAIIHPLGIDVEDADDLVRIFLATLGTVGLVIFALGLWGATFSTFVGGNAGYVLIFTDICRSFVPSLRRSPGSQRRKQPTNKDPIYRWMIAFCCFSPLYIIFIDVRPVWLVLFINALVVVLIPVLAMALLIITNNKKLMGSYQNGWFTNSVMLILVSVSIYFTYKNSIALLNNLAERF
jgi:Mn2+/Fe2+ NRAMP family transporter